MEILQTFPRVFYFPKSCINEKGGNRGWKYCFSPLENFEIILAYQRCDFMYFGGKKRRKKELSVMVKFEVASGAVSPFKYYFPLMKHVTLQVLIYCCTNANFNNI